MRNAVEDLRNALVHPLTSPTPPPLSLPCLSLRFITTDTSASSICAASSASDYDGQMFEAIPTETCIAQSLGDDNNFSVMFSKDETMSPYVTYYFSR